MTSPDKKYIAVDRNSGETFRFNAEDWANSQKEFMTDFPDAEIVEYDAYKPENLQDNDTIFVDTEDGQYTFTPEEWKESEEEFRKDFKTVNPTIARGYDYYYNSAKEVEGNMATQGSKIADWEQRRKDFLASLSHEDSAKIDQSDIQKQSGVQGMPLNENDPIVAQYNALMAEGDELKAEQDRLRGEYEANPRVKTAMEEWAKEYAQYKAESIDRTRNEIAKAKEEGVDLKSAAQAKIAKAQSMSMTGAMSAHTDLKGLSELQKLERLESANYFLDMAQDAKDGKMNGFWKGMKDVGSAFVETIKNRGDIANYVDIFNIMKKLEEKVGNLKNITDEEIDNNLTESERLLLKSYFEYADAIANADTDWKYKAGQIGGEGIKFAIEFALTAGASGAVSSAVTKGLTDGIERWAMKAIGNGAKKWLVQAAEKTAIGATRGALNVVLQTALRPSTYAQMAQKSIEIDEYGHLNGAKNSAISFIDSTIETLSEMSGDAIGKLLGFIPMKGVKGFAGKMFDKTLGMTKFGQYGKALLKGAFGDYLKAAGFHGAPIEMLEEVVGSALREMTIDDKAFEESFGGDNKYAMALGFLPMTFMGGAFSMAGLGASQIAAKNASSALATTLANYKFADGRIKALTDYQSDMSPLQMQLEAKEIISELKKNGASEADIETVNNYMTSKAGYLAMRGAKSEQDAEDRANVIADMESQYGDFYQKKDGMNEVTVAVLNDGRRVFVTSEKNENGEFSAIDQTTGKGTIINESDIKTIDTPIGISQQVMTRMSLDEYASNAINERMQLAEIERMSNERNAQIAELSRLLPKAINLGTTGERNMVAVKSQDQKGVTVVDAEGNEAVLSWDEVGMKMGAPIKVLTDAQIAEAEAAEIGLSRAERRAQRAKTEGQANVVDAEVNAINEEVKDVTPAPEEAYTNPENGLVDEDAFWEGDPEGFCEWNDRLNNDGGQDSREQIESSLVKLQAKMEQTRKLAMDEPKARRAVKAEMQKLQERIDRLTALQQKYAEMAMTEEQKAQERAELVLLMRERVNQWRELLGLTEEDLVVYESLDEVEDQNAINQIARAKTEGWYSGASKRAFLFLPDITSLDELDAKVMHEVVTHYGLDKVMTPEAKNQLLDTVWGMMSDAARRAYLSYPGVNTLNGIERQRAAANEFMAKVAESVKVGNASAEQKSVWQRIVDFFNNLFKKVNAFFNGADVADFVLENYRLLTNNIKPSMPTAVTEEIAVEPEISQSEVDTQVETILNESGISLMGDLAENVMAQAETMTNEEGLPIASNTNDGTELFSTTTAKPWTDNLGNEHKGTMEMVLERMQQMEFSEQEIRQMEAKMQTAYDYMMKLQSLTNPDGSVRFEEFNAWAEKTPLYKQVGRDYVKAITSLVSNGDYPINLELTTDCIKREAFTMLLNELVKRGADLAGMGPAEIVTIQKMMKQYGIQVACALCFVEGKRLQIVNWASQIVNDWNDALIEAGVETDEMFEFGKDGDAFIPSEEWRTYEDKPKLAKALRTIDEVARIFQGVDPKVYKAQKAKNEKALKKYIKEKEEAAAKKGKKWTPTDEQKREMKKIKVAGLTPTYVNENMKEYTAAFEQMRNEWVAKSPKKGPMRDPLDFTPTKTQWDELEKIRNRQIENVKQKMVRLIMEYPEMRKKMTLNDLLGSKGLMEIRQQHGVAYEQLYSIILQRFGTGTPKPVQDAVPYDGEVMTLTESAFKAANKIGGARLFSFSDFDITKVFDYMQMFFDLEANRQMLQSYTKEVAAILLFGKSNAKFNISTLASAVVPAEVLEEYENASEGKRKDMRHQWAENAGLLVDDNGTITGINFSEEHSVSPEFAQQIFHDDSRNKDCGAIMVGASVNHAIYSAAQAWIRMVIPFHLSGMPIAARDKTDVKWWTDNTEYQSTRKKTKDGWSKISDKENTFEFYADMHQEGWNMRDKAREYLDWCKDNAFRPKFDWGINSDYYRAYCKENGYTPNQQIIDMMDADTTNGVWNQYYKFLTDFTAYKPVFNEEGEMIDEIPSPQQRVISNFDMSEMEKQVIFEGENSMLARREGNIELANQHVSELADKVTPYLNGQITEEEMGLRDDVFYDARKDANAYLEATGNLLYSSTAKRRARKQLPEDLKMKEVVEKYGGIWIGNRQEYAKFVSAVNNWYFEKDGIGLVYADIHHMYQYYWNENGEPIPFRKFYISDSTRERIDNLIEQENEQRADITVREITSENYDFVKNVEANAEGSTLDNTSVPMPLGDDNMAEDLLGEGAYANNPELYVTSSRPNKTKAKFLFSTFNNNQAIFVSNAAKAVEGIKQEKATPEQWLKMIEKNGGLKAGEDKWMGLSDWLKASDKKTLTKAEVLDFINEHMIVIEEQHYSNEEMGKASVKILNEKYQGWEDAFSFEWDGYMEEPNADISDYEAAVELYNKHHDEKVALDGDGEFENMDDYEKVRQFGVELSEIYHGSKSEVRPIDGTREQYTTQGLQHLHEIALTVPTIESWNESDDIHFGDAGDGRAVAWVRFGDTTSGLESDGMRRRSRQLADELERKYGSMWNSDEIYEQMSVEDKAKRDEADRLYHLSDVDAEWIENKRQFADRMADRGYPEAAERERREADEAERLWDEYRAASSRKKVLVIDEIQSKRHQEGREKGYKSEYKNSKEAQRLKAEVDRVTARLMELVNDRRENEESELTELARLDIALDNATSIAEYDAILEEQEKIRAHRENREAEELAVRGERRELAYLLDKQIDRDAVSAISAVPDAPFDKNWHELAMKRMLRYAAENGYDAIAWTKGEQQAERYNLGKIYNEIEREDNPNIKGRTFSFSGGNYDKVTVNEDGVVVDSTIEEAKGKPLSDLVGKDLAVKMMSLENYDTIDGEELRIGGEGMKGFYDRMLPAFMNKYGKKWGIKVEDIELPNLEEAGRIMHSVPVTDEMKESVMEGQLMFSTKSANFESAITPEVRKEMDVISAQAIVNGNYLLAPNGQPTKLTPEQWALVRTQNFKNWFGDWINDPENASKVVDENGEPKVVYHQTNAVVYINRETGENWDELDWRARQEWDERDDWEDYWEEQDFNTFSRINARTTNEFDGFFFAPNYDEHHEYGDRTIAAFLNIKHPASNEDYNIDSSKNNAGREERIRLQNEGFDGVIRMDGEEVDEYIAFSPNQIKSATENNGEFSESEDIRFSTDSRGKSLSPGQKAFFANSKAVDKDGNLLVLYHGTPRAGFTEFNSGWFTTSKEDAISYSGDRKGRLFDPSEEYVPETLTAGDFPLGYMTFDSEEDRAAFLAEHPTAESALSESEYENARIQAEDEEYDALTERKAELEEIWNAYREYERERFVDTTIGELLENPNAYTEDDFRRAMLAYDSNASFDGIEEMDAEERKDVLIAALNNANEETEGGILDLNVETRVPRNGEGLKHNDTNARTYEVYANIQSPYEVDANGRGSEFVSGDIYKAVEEALADEQYDGVIIRNWRVGRYQQLGDVVVPKNGNQIKLTSNENPTESEDVRFSTTTIDISNATLKDDLIKLNGLDRFNLTKAFKGIKDGLGNMKYFKVTIQDVPNDAPNAYNIDFRGSLEGHATIYVPESKIMDGNRINPKDIEAELWKVLNAAKRYQEYEYGKQGKYSFDWLEDNDILFSTRQPNQSAEEFYNESVNAFRRKYNEVAEIRVLPVNEETAKEWGITLDELKKVDGTYVEDEDYIALFAQEHVTKSRLIDDTIFHESIHKLAMFFDSLPKLGEWLWNNTKEGTVSAMLKDSIANSYEESKWHHELLAYLVGYSMTFGKTNALYDVLPQEMKGNLELILNEIGYDKQQEMGGLNDGESDTNGEGDSGKKSQSDADKGENAPSEERLLFSTTGREKSVEEIVEEGKQKVSAEHTQTVDAFMDRIRRINGNLQQLRMAAAAQREYDQKTVKTITDIANDLLEGGALNDLTRGEIKRLLSIINGGVGKSDLTKSVNRLMDLMVANQLRYGKSLIEKFLKIRGSKVDQRGVEVRGTLDIPGQQMLNAFKEGIGLTKDKLADRIAEAEDALSSDSETKKRNAENELVGFYLAKQYHEDINDSIEEEKDLRNEIKVADEDYKAGKITKEMHKQLLDTIYEAILENRIQRVNAYEKLASDLGAKMVSSIKNAGLLRDAEKERVQKIQHFANSDMQGMPASTHEVKQSKFWNNALVELITSPLVTFEQWLRVFGEKSAEGKGYLWNHFMTKWNDSNNNEYKGMQEAHMMLDSMVRSVFGGNYTRWSDLFSIEKEMPTLAVSIWDDGEMKDYELSQGNLLYIYMVNKMVDGKMKLRKMGITQDVVDAIVAQMDPRFIQLADWMQEVFLPSLRDKYNAVHERLFGAPMASIDNYFPIKVNQNARVREVDVEAGEGVAKPATITGSIIKRTKNSLALDVLNADAFDVMLEHIQQMEHWAAFAEFNKDLNTLLSYKKFRNRVQNMSGVMGAGLDAWKNFKESAEIAAGVYKPKTGKADKAITNIVKGLTAGKISFRLWTAMKQILSMPAFAPYTNLATFGKNLGSPMGAFNWAMENLPAFEKRWKSREAGNVRLKKTEVDIKMADWMETATRLGMTPNAFVDAITCAIGAKSVYETKYNQYVKDGYTEEQAKEKAKLDATVAFNATQQSSEAAFLSSIQIDRTFVSHALTVFRNNSFGMQRELVDAVRNMRHRMSEGYKEKSIEFMKKQMIRDGLAEDKAERAAQRIYRNSTFKDAARIATFGFMMQFLWALGNSAVYMLFGDDDEDKRKMLKEAAIRGAFGSIEGLGGGNIVAEGLAAMANGTFDNYRASFTPAISDIESMVDEMKRDMVAGASDLVNLLVQMGFGVNPQILADAAVAIYDACDGGLETSKEAGILILRLLQAPQSNIDKLFADEIDFTKDKGLDLTIEEFAQRYADYKAYRNAPYTYWIYDDEAEKKQEQKYIKRFLKDAEELKRSRGNEEAKKYYEYLDTDYKETTETINELKRKAEAAGMKGDQIGVMEYAKMLDDFMKTDLFKDYVKFGGKAKAIESIRDKMKKVDLQTRESLETMMLDLRRQMVEEMEEANR